MKRLLQLLPATLLALGVSSLSLPAHAQSEPEPDTSILSDSLNYDDVAKKSTFTGNVILTRGNLTLLSDELTVTQDEAGNQHGLATMKQNPRVRIRQEDPSNYELVTAEGLQAKYSGQDDAIELIGQAIVNRYICGELLDTMQGERIIYHQKTSTYQAFGGAQSPIRDGRVRSVSRPRSKADAAIATCQRKSKN